MPRRKKKKPLTIQSSETKILLGLMMFLIGLTILISPFLTEQSPLFDNITLILGYTSIAWGILIIYLSFFFLTKKKKFVSAKQSIGLFFFSACLNILLSFWLIEEQLNSPEALRGAGGQLGKLLHLSLNDFFGGLIEIIIVLILLIISFSLITGTTLEQIRDFLEDSVPEEEEKEGFSLRSFFKKLAPTKDLKDIKITAENDKEEEIPKVESEEEIQRRLDSILTEEKTKEETRDTIDETQDTDLRDNGDTSKRKDVENKEPEKPRFQNWKFPGVDILQEGEIQEQDKELYKEKALVIEQTLRSFGIQAKVVAVAVGPTVLRFSLSISVGVKVSRIKNLSNDLALALASQTSSVRIEAPIPGTSYVGVEIPNPTPNFVYAKEMVTRLRKEKDKYELPLILGKDITAKTRIKDLAKIPHLLVAGATGTGKSVAINSLLTGLLMTKSPDEVKFLMIDPKMGVEMAIYNGIPHLLNPVITDSEAVINALQWTIEEMMRRYRQLKQVRVKKLTEYNKKVGYLAMPYIIVVVDEMADLILSSGVDVETKIQRLAQMGRAVGIHLILATQKPTVNVITGLIKSNIPGRMAFAVATSVDSRVILDESGAETLLGNGDMLYKDQTTPKSLRIQGTNTTTEDSESVIEAIKEQVKDKELKYSEDLTEAIEKGPADDILNGKRERDPEFEKALAVVLSTQKASSSFLQRKMRIGYNKAARIIDQLHAAGVVGPQKGSKPRDVLITSPDEISDKLTEDDEDMPDVVE
jgi:DNA segregation ATPase FtsK/SpoIIIE, S-DNA-T family